MICCYLEKQRGIELLQLYASFGENNWTKTSASLHAKIRLNIKDLLSGALR